MKIQHFRLVNKVPVPCSMMEWATEWEKNRRIAHTIYRKMVVSTIFLGISIGEDEPLFETMVFNGPFADTQVRDYKWEQAIATHEKWVKHIKSVSMFQWLWWRLFNRRGLWLVENSEN